MSGNSYSLTGYDPYKDKLLWGTSSTRTYIDDWLRPELIPDNNRISYRDCYNMVHRMDIKNVIFNPPATIVYWNDGTKTVVKTEGDDIFDPEKGLAMAIAKKALGNKGNYYNSIKKWIKEFKED